MDEFGEEYIVAAPPAGDASSVSGTTKVYGYLNYELENGTEKPLVGIKVKITIKKRGFLGFDAELKEEKNVSTDSGGYYSYGFDHGENDYNVSVDYYAVGVYPGSPDTKTFEIKTTNGNTPHSRGFSTTHVPAGETKNVGTETVHYYSEAEVILWGTLSGSAAIPYMRTCQSFYLTQPVVCAQNFAIEKGGLTKFSNKFITIVYPTNKYADGYPLSNFSYLNESHTIYVNIAHFDNWGIVMHEYGHHMQRTLGINKEISSSDYNGNHLFHEDLIYRKVYEEKFDVSYGKGKSFAMQLAWSESWATAFAMMAQKYSAGRPEYSGIPDFGTGTYLSKTGVKFPVATYDPANTVIPEHPNLGDLSGEGQELAINAFLWDLFSTNNTNIPGSSNWTPLGYNAFWDVSKKTKSLNPAGNDLNRTLSQFVALLEQDYPQYRSQIGQKLAFLRIAPGNFTITNIQNISESVAPQFSWRVNGSIYNPNNRFQIAFYNAAGVEKYVTPGYISSSVANNSTITYTLTSSEWNDALSQFSANETMSIAVKGYLAGAKAQSPAVVNTPISGPYWSACAKWTPTISLTYTLINNGTAYAVSGGTVTGTLTIPSAYNGLPVTAIENGAFQNQTQLSQITIPSSVTSIGKSAFDNTGIWNNTPNNSVVYADKWVVGYKSIYASTISLAGNTVGIGNYALAGWGGTDLTLPASIENVGVYVFDNCSALTVTITNASQLRDIANNHSTKYKLGNNINLSGQWTPISTFYGTFDGNGKTISGLTITGLTVSTNEQAYGLFAKNYGRIENLYLTGVNIDFDHEHSDIWANVGAVAGINEVGGLIENVHLTGAQVTERFSVDRSYSRTGGIVGANYGLIYDVSVSNAHIFGNGDMGGIAGGNFPGGAIFFANVQAAWIWHWAKHNRAIGGIVGYFDGGGQVDSKMFGCSVNNTLIEIGGIDDTPSLAPCVGKLAGFIVNSKIESCTMLGTTELRAWPLTASQQVNIGQFWNGNQAAGYQSNTSFI